MLTSSSNVHDRKRLPKSVSINLNENDRDPKSKLSLINRHCGAIPHRRRVSRLKSAASIFKDRPWAQAATADATRLKPQDIILPPISDEELEQPGANSGAHCTKYFTYSGRAGPTKMPCIRPSTVAIPTPSRTLNVLPIQATGDIPIAFEFFVHVWAPLIVRIPLRPQIDTQSLKPGFQTYVQVMLNDPMLFEVLMAESLVMRAMTGGVTTRARTTAASMYHSTRALRQLGQRLDSNVPKENTSDAVIMTLISLTLMAFHRSEEYDVNVGLYLHALQSIVALRGGYEVLGWNGFLALKAKQIDGALTPLRDKPRDTSLVIMHPQHPFNPALCERISILPEGFRELGLCGQLSLRFISILEEFIALRRNTCKEENAAIVAFAALANYCWGSTNEQAISAARLTPIGSLLMSTLLAYCHYLEGHAVPSCEIGLQAYIKAFQRKRDFYINGEYDEYALDWAALMLCATMVKGSDAWDWAAHMLYTINIMTDHRQRLLEEMFLPIPRPDKKPGCTSSATQGVTTTNIRSSLHEQDPIEQDPIEQDPIEHNLEELHTIASTLKIPVR